MQLMDAMRQEPSEAELIQVRQASVHIPSIKHLLERNQIAS